MSDIRIDITNTIAGQTSGGVGTPSATGTQGVNWSAISAQFLVTGARKLIGATGNSEIASFMKKGAKYGFGAMRILASGGTDVAAIAGMALDIAGDAISKANEVARKQATMENEIDAARVRAGLLDLSETTRVSENWWSGRYEYGRGS